MADKTGLGALRGTPLVGAITSVCASSFLLFGYDQGVMSGVVISEYWLDAMGQPSTVMIGTITALYDIGGVFGAIAAALCVEQLGRKRGLLAGAALIVIGAILMGSCAERIQFIIGRIITGLGTSNQFQSLTPMNRD
jgi:MFS family permease